jgi:hypothetical protein
VTLLSACDTSRGLKPKRSGPTLTNGSSVHCCRSPSGRNNEPESARQGRLTGDETVSRLSLQSHEDHFVSDVPNVTVSPQGVANSAYMAMGNRSSRMRGRRNHAGRLP